MRTEVVQFIEASRRYDDASASLMRARGEARTAEDNLKVTWEQLTKAEQDEVNEAYASMRGEG